MERLKDIKNSNIFPDVLSDLISKYDYYIEGKINHIKLGKDNILDLKLLNENQIIYIIEDKYLGSAILNILNLNTDTITMVDNIDPNFNDWTFRNYINRPKFLLFVYDTKIFISKRYDLRANLQNLLKFYYSLNLEYFEFIYKGDILDIIQLPENLYCIATKKEIVIWELIQNYERKIITYESDITAIIKFKSSNEEYILFNDGNLKLWDYNTNNISIISKNKPGYQFKNLNSNRILIYKTDNSIQYIFDGIEFKQISICVIKYFLECFKEQIIYEEYSKICIFNSLLEKNIYDSNFIG